MLKNWAFFSESCGFDRMRASSVLGGGSWRSQLVQTRSMHQLTLRNRPLVQSHHALTSTDICTVLLGVFRIGLPGHILAPNKGLIQQPLCQKLKLKKSAGTTAVSDESSSLQLLFSGGCDHDQATFVMSAILYKSQLPIVLQHQDDIMQT